MALDGAADIPVGLGGLGNNQPVFDSRIVNKPSTIPNRDRWSEWRFGFENFMTLIHLQFGDDLNVAALEVNPVDDTVDAELRRRSTYLYSILAGLAKDKSMVLVRQIRSTRNGYEVWRLLCADMEPVSDNRKLAMSIKISECGQLKNKTASQFPSALFAWEEDILEYEKFPNTRFDEDLKRALLLKYAPAGIKEHLILNPRTTYLGMRDAIESYLRIWLVGVW